MKEYPSIPAQIQLGLPIYSFYKYDGSMIRSEFSKKRGFYKFGSRRRLLGTDQFIIHKAEGLVKAQEDLVRTICAKRNWDSIILFYEFLGSKSSFGNHVEDDDHQVHLIDANPYKKGILPPREFIDIFGEFPNVAPCLYQGNCNNSFVLSVRDGTLEGMGPEGVVCKFKGRGNEIGMFKVKRQSWYAALREHCKDDEKMFEALK